MKKTYKLALLVITFLLFVSVSVFFSYSSYLNSNNDNKTLVLSNEYLSVNYSDGNVYDYPDFTQGSSIIKRLSITNVTEETFNFTLAIMDINNINGDLEVKVLDKDDKVIFNSTLDNVDTELIKEKEIFSNETLNYTIIITNNGNSTEFGADLLVYREYAKKIEATFKDTILKNNSIDGLQTEIGTVATTNEGLLLSNDELGSTYYFRGNVNNNYVKINDLLFRIIRINGDGSVRLILDGIIEQKSKFVKSIKGTNYLNNVILSDSYVKEVLDSWYNNYLNSYDNYITYSNFCYDNNFYLQNEGEDLTNSYNRIFVNNTPTLECTDGIDSLKIGLLSVDELIFAGASKDSSNTNFYLYNANIDSSWWTSSTSNVISKSNIVNNFIVTNTGEVDTLGKLTTEYGIRPVISLDKNVRVTGNGTIDEPYEIVS